MTAALVLRLFLSGKPRDQAAWLMLGETLEELGQEGDADATFLRVIELGEYTPAGKQAKEARSRIAEAVFHRQTSGMERPDAVMYCVSAIELFEGMPDAEVESIAFEIGVLAASGLEVGDPAPKYRLKSLPGEFSALNLLCLMYVGFERIEPGMGIGFDLRQEYEVARGMVEGRGVATSPGSAGGGGG